MKFGRLSFSNMSPKSQNIDSKIPGHEFPIGLGTKKDFTGGKGAEGNSNLTQHVQPILRVHELLLGLLEDDLEFHNHRAIGITASLFCKKPRYGWTNGGPVEHAFNLSASRPINSGRTVWRYQQER